MMDTQLVNALVENLDNAPEPKREPAAVEKRLAYCQQVCPAWYQRCTRHPDTIQWVELMITPGQHCVFNWGNKFSKGVPNGLS